METYQQELSQLSLNQRIAEANDNPIALKSIIQDLYDVWEIQRAVIHIHQSQHRSQRDTILRGNRSPRIHWHKIEPWEDFA